MQEGFLGSFGGVRDNQAKRCLLQQHPLQHKEREHWMNALGHVPSVAHAQAHAIASNLPSMGSLMQACLDPSRQAFWFGSCPIVGECEDVLPSRVRVWQVVYLVESLGSLMQACQDPSRQAYLFRILLFWWRV